MTHVWVDGREVDIPGDAGSLLDALRDHPGVTSVKDGCSPQGQCGCCTVLVDGAPRVACVTPLRRVAGRSITTVDGLEGEVVGPLVEALTAAGASQCGFCTPGILVRLAALGTAPTPDRVETALLAHLCRCTGWRTIVDAVAGPPSGGAVGVSARDLAAAGQRAALEGGVPQAVGPNVTLGRAGFAADTPPAGHTVAVPDGHGGWQTGETVGAARAAVAAVQGRRSGHQIDHPLEVPPGEWAVTLRTTWVEPAYLEPDASWCRPGGDPVSPAANGGAFGAKTSSPAPAAARELADELGRPVLVVLSREDVVRLGPKRPPIAAGVRADGTGVLRVVATPGVAAAVASVAPGLVVEEVEVPGPPTSSAVRAAGWAEALILAAAARSRRLVNGPAESTAAGSLATRSGALAPAVANDGCALSLRGAKAHPSMVHAEQTALGPEEGAGRRGQATITGPTGATASAAVDVDDAGAPCAVAVTVRCGPPLDEVVLRSYAIGAAHMALGWVCSEAIAVDAEGVPADLTIRSFGVLRAKDTPPVTVEIDASEGWNGSPVGGSDTVFAAVAAATWIAQGLPEDWPTRRRSYR